MFADEKNDKIRAIPSDWKRKLLQKDTKQLAPAEPTEESIEKCNKQTCEHIFGVEATPFRKHSRDSSEEGSTGKRRRIVTMFARLEQQMKEANNNQVLTLTKATTSSQAIGTHNAKQHG